MVAVGEMIASGVQVQTMMVRLGCDADGEIWLRGFISIFEARRKSEMLGKIVSDKKPEEGQSGALQALEKELRSVDDAIGRPKSQIQRIAGLVRRIDRLKGVSEQMYWSIAEVSTNTQLVG